MKFLDRLEKKFRGRGIPNVTVYLIAGQTVFYVLYLTGKLDRSVTSLAGALLLQGEWWRAATFLFDPPVSNPLFALFAWYIFYFMGAALEEQWGAFRYNFFLLAGVVMTVAAALVVPYQMVTNAFLAGSVFLAFATLYPDYTLMLFMVLPVKVKWLAWITWAGYGFKLLFGGWGTRVVVLAAVFNLLLFFGGDLLRSLRSGRRRSSWRSRTAEREQGHIHRCSVCGITDLTHPKTDFRYCPQCEGQRGYCPDHIFSHQHVGRK
ncbi:MAG TPA: hypothetical protein VNX25_08470 [Verrucomicrobiae bacterium]|nr:hypothetical protein [Verrucomicrobiae bacterium]